MVAATAPLIVVWREDCNGRRCRWNLRGIRQDGEFFGDATFYDERRQTNLKGKLSAEHTAEVWRLAGDIQAVASANCPTDGANAWDALLGEGHYGAPSIIYRYCAEEEESPRITEDFKALIALLRTYVETACSA